MGRDEKCARFACPGGGETPKSPNARGGDDRQNPSFTMSISKARMLSHAAILCVVAFGEAGDGGARRDRTDDLKLAKLPLSQLSYGPVSPT